MPWPDRVAAAYPSACAGVSSLPLSNETERERFALFRPCIDMFGGSKAVPRWRFTRNHKLGSLIAGNKESYDGIASAVARPPTSVTAVALCIYYIERCASQRRFDIATTAQKLQAKGQPNDELYATVRRPR